MSLHNRRRFVRMAMLVVATVACLAPGARAADKPALPASLVRSVDGASMPLVQFGVDGQRIFIYVLPDSPASGRLIEALGEWELSSLGRIAIVVGGDQAAAAAFAKRDRGLPELQWALDPDKTAWTDLRVTGVPSLFGVRNGVVEWRLAGVLNDPTALRAIITSWTRQVAP